MSRYVAVRLNGDMWRRGWGDGSRRYHFMTNWRVAAPVEECWAFLTSPDQTWVEWWPSLDEIEVRRTREFVGSTADCVWRSPLGHRMRFALTVAALTPREQIVLSSDGDLAGTGVVDFAPNGNGSRLTITWTIRTTRRWMNVTAPVLRPAFTWAHHVVMRHGERGLNRVLTHS